MAQVLTTGNFAELLWPGIKEKGIYGNTYDGYPSMPKGFMEVSNAIRQVLDESIAGSGGVAAKTANVLGSDESRKPQNTIELSAEEVRIVGLMGISPETYARQKSFLNR